MDTPDEQILMTSKGHQWLTLIGATFVVFEIVFIVLYSNNFWFTCNLTWFGLPAILIAGAAAYGLLKLGAGRFGCRVASPFLKGKPPVVFEKWLGINAGGFRFGRRHVNWHCIDGVNLTLFGNVEILSRAVCGADSAVPDVVFKFPFAPAAQETQQKFIDALKAARPDVVFNKRLEKRLTSPIVKGQNMVQFAGAAMMLVLLLDLGYSSFYYLEMLKHYYLADVHALASEDKEADAELRLGDDLRAHPLPVSYITTRFLNVGSCASGVSSARADTLWHMNRREDALAETQRAIESSPENFRGYLHYARLLEQTGKVRDAREQLRKAVDKHKDSLLPRLYLMANASDERRELAATEYRNAMDELKEKVFGDEPIWPPGGNPFVHDVFYRDDVKFVLDRLIGSGHDGGGSPATKAN